MRKSFLLNEKKYAATLFSSQQFLTLTRRRATKKGEMESRYPIRWGEESTAAQGQMCLSSGGVRVQQKFFMVVAAARTHAL